MGLAACELSAAVAPGFRSLLIAMAMSSTLCGVALGMSQATLIEARPAASEKTMMRWMMMGAFGDLLAPILVAAMAAAMLPWRAMFAISGIVWLLYAAAQACWPLPAGASVADESPAQGRWSSLQAAIRNPALLRWAILLELLCLLDEILFLRRTRHCVIPSW